MNHKKIKVLLELRPALEGFAGIPQETRLLFRGLRNIEGIDVEGLLQTSYRRLARGTSLQPGLFEKQLSQSRRYNRFSNVIISMVEKPYRSGLDIIIDWLRNRIEQSALQVSVVTGLSKIKLTRFESDSFQDFAWRTLFSKTLPASDYSLIAPANHLVCSVPWNVLHRVGLGSLNWRLTPKYPKLDTKGIDIFIGQTPYPARVDKHTAMVIRYHDAIPVFMPHTIPEKSKHQATHFYALMNNVKCGAWFACTSEATRQDLIRLFPEASDRAVTIHNMVSHHYFREESAFERVPQIVRSRLYEESGFLPKFFSLKESEVFYKNAIFKGLNKYVLVVSTIEPRKNHLRLLAAWEMIKSQVDAGLKMVVVGTLGWDNASTTSAFKPWIDRGELFMLNAVPAPDLRVLYRHAAATVCPSLGEGFDFSGVESMASGGITIASDIPVHREIYEDAAEYFDPYSTMSLVKALRKVLYEEGAAQAQERMRCRGQEISARYQPEKILPQWEIFLQRVVRSKSR